MEGIEADLFLTVFGARRIAVFVPASPSAGFSAMRFRKGPEAMAASHSVCSGGPKEAEPLTLIWFIVWLIANVVVDNEPLTLDPVNWWAGTLILTFALDLSRQHAPQFGRTPRGE
jgi:hypothetical protein